MRVYTVVIAAVILGIAACASAQQRPIYDPDDSVDPRQHVSAIFISRLVLGGGSDLTDDYRPLPNDSGFLLVTNSVYWKQIQLDDKRSKVFNNEGKVELQRCGCQPPIDFPTPPSPDSTPSAPPQRSKDTLQFGFYYRVLGRATEPRVILRVRLTGSTQRIDTVVRSFATQEVV
jgi:hypothetical protein